jgi:hypothetical protein
MTILNLCNVGRSDGVSRKGITVSVLGRGYYNPTRSLSSNASSDSLPFVPGNIAATGLVDGRRAPERVRGGVRCALDASVQAPPVKRDYRKYSFLFLSTD